jgi:hypothetical protein
MGAGGGRFYCWVERFLGRAKVTTLAGQFSSGCHPRDRLRARLANFALASAFRPILIPGIPARKV